MKKIAIKLFDPLLGLFVPLLSSHSHSFGPAQACACGSAPRGGPRGHPNIRVSPFSSGVGEESSRSARLAPAEHISETNVTDLLPSDDAPYEIASSKAGR